MSALLRGLRWMRDVYEIAGDVPAIVALTELAGSSATWVVVRLGAHRWVLKRREVVRLLDTDAVVSGGGWRGLKVQKALNLSVKGTSTTTPSPTILSTPSSGSMAFAYPPARRYVHVGAKGEAIGVVELTPQALTRAGLLERPLKKGRGSVRKASRPPVKKARPPVKKARLPLRMARPSVKRAAPPAASEPMDFEPVSGAEPDEAAPPMAAAPAPDETAAPAPPPVMRGMPDAPPPPPPRARGIPAMPRGVPKNGHSAESAPPASPTPDDDEGTNPRRFPSLESDTPPVRGQRITITVDLARQQTTHTAGGALDVGELAADWSTLTIDARLMSSGITFDGGGQGQVTIRRNQDSIAAMVSGTVTVDGPIDVAASFMCGSRFVGMATRRFETSASAAATPVTVGVVSVDVQAAQPDVTVEIYVEDQGQPGKLHWVVRPRELFDGLPPQLDGYANLGTGVAEFAGAMFVKFAQLERGQHAGKIESHGDELWRKAPACWQESYWALVDHYQRPLTIQFVTDEPSIAWELMRPSRRSGSKTETHKPLALEHSVARWVAALKGMMRNRLPKGRLYTIVPRYKSASRALKRAEAEGEKLKTDYSAQVVEGKYQNVLSLLRASDLTEPIALLHFAGHGKFDAGAVTESAILLEDGEVTVSELASPDVHLGEKYRPLVFFNACEVGATGQVLGAVGGWGRACIERSFSGFIAPLWAVDDEDAGTVAAELLKGILVDHTQPVSSVLREIRRTHGATSPTFYSYVFFGDVTARIA